jgi:hypothetical protein
MSRHLPGLTFAVLLVLSGSASAQMARAIADGIANADGPPGITSISPPGAPLGKMTEWTVSGSNLGAVTDWKVSGAGVSVVGVKADKNVATLQVKVDANAAAGYREVRAVSAKGISNLALVRLDNLALVQESEPNDVIENATPIPAGSAAWGVLKAQDLDHFRVAGKAGRRVTIDLEAQRLGAPISPVITVMTARGSALAQARESLGTDHDARLAFTFPGDGDYVILVRDNLYAGGDSAVYRLSVEDAPFATGLFPLGGPRGGKVEVAVSGGNLASPRTRTVTLPDQPGAIFVPGPFDGQGGSVLSPMKMVVGDGVEAYEEGSPTAIPVGVSIVNGRIGAPNEVDRYTLQAKKGAPIAVRIRASDLGSQLDSVVTVRDEQGATLAENDDPAGDGVQRGGFAINQTASPPDSRLVVEPKSDGPITIEVADRYGEGGPGFAYRLEVGPVRPDFSVSLIFANPAAVNQQQMGRAPARRASSPGSNGALNLRAGTSVPLNYLVTSEGPTGPIEIRAEGLPPGVTAFPRTIRPTPTANRNGLRGSANADAIILKVDDDAEGSLGELRLVAEAKPADGPPIIRTATATVAIDTPLGGTAPPRSVMRTLASIPIKIIGSKSELEKADGKNIVMGAWTVTGAVLQGGRLDLVSGITASAAALRDSNIVAKVSGDGVTAQVVLPEDGAGPIIRLTAGVDAAPGARTVGVTLFFRGEETGSNSATIIVRPPIEVRARDERIVMAKGKPSALWVGVTREAGFDGPVDLKVDLPPGVRVVGKTTVPADQAGMELLLEGEMAGTEPFAVRVTGVARMPRGPVRIESAIRPMIVSRSAEKGE